MIEIAKNKDWDEESQDIPEEEEDEEAASPRAGWRPGGLDEELERAAKSSQPAPDWRDEAFHGDSPAKRNGSEPWSPSPERAGVVEAAETKVAAVTTIDAKPAESPLPFSGDAWAAAMAAGVEDKLAKQTEPVVAEPQPVGAAEPEHDASLPEIEFSTPVAPALTSAHGTPVPASSLAPVVPAPSTEPPNWAAAVPESSWEAEAKRASMLASTWDAPAPVAPTEETQEVSAYSAEQPEAHVEAHSGEEASSAYAGHYQPEPGSVVPEAIPSIDTSAEVAVEPAPSNNWANAWEASPAAPATPEPVVEPVQDVIEAPQPESSASPAAAETTAPPDMDELVARVLGKMNPDVLQKVTREILKPVIEAIIRDELDSKKS